MRKLKSSDETFNLYALLRRVNDAIVHARNKELAQYGMNVRQASTLYMIETLGTKATPAEISRWQYRMPHTVSHLLQKMVKDGLVTKRKDLVRKNQVRAVLTQKGEQAYHEATRRESIHRIMSVLSKAEARQLRTLLEKLGVAASENNGPAGKSEIGGTE